MARRLGTPVVRRASHVEPWADLSESAKRWLRERGVVGENLSGDVWFADLSPVAGPVLGPFACRDEALAAEVAWLRENHIPTPVGTTPTIQDEPK